MKWNKALIMKYFSASFAVLFVLCMQPVYAFALELRIRNDFDTTMRVALIYFEENSDRWRVTGWYVAPPQREKTVTLNTSKKDIYIYAKLENESLIWGDGEITRIVITDAFSYYDGQECPRGSRRRGEKFTKFVAKNNVLEFRPRAEMSNSISRPGGNKPLPAQSTKLGDAEGSSVAGEFSKEAALLLELINAERKKSNAPILKLDETMCRAANRRAVELTKKYSHDRPNGRDYNSVFAEFGLFPRKSAENIAWRSGKGNTSMKNFNKAFMESKGHRINILNSNYSNVGLGFAKAGDKYYVVELFAGDLH